MFYLIGNVSHSDEIDQIKINICTMVEGDTCKVKTFHDPVFP